MKRTLAFLTTLFVAFFFVGAIYMGTAEASPTRAHCVDNPQTHYFNCYSSHQALLNAIAAKPGRAIIGQDYQNTNYGGAELVWYLNHKCSSSTHIEINRLGAGWNDQISSVKVFPKSGCNSRSFYSNSYVGGNADRYTRNASHVRHNDAYSSEIIEHVTNIVVK